MNFKVTAFLLCMSPLTGFSQTFTTSSEYGLPLTLSTTEINETGSLAKFDSSLGVLTGATLIIYTGAEFSLTGTNNSAQAQTAVLSSNTSLFIKSTDEDISAVIQDQNPKIRLSASTDVTTFQSGETIDFGTFDAAGSFSYDLSSVLDAVQDTAGGTFDINAQSLSGFAVEGGGGNIGTDQKTVAGAGARIIYTYEAVPEPSSALLASLSVFTLLFRRKRSA